MKSVIQIIVLVAFFFSGCKTDDCSSFVCDFDFKSDEFDVCLEGIPCEAFEGDYCLFGFKWGANNDFGATGPNAEGPSTPGGLVSYSFQENASMVSNHTQVNVPTLPFDILPDCAKSKIDEAFVEWSRFGDIQFQKLPKDSDSDIKIFVAKIFIAGLAYPNLSSSSCQQIGGHIIFNPYNSNFPRECDQFYSLALHEVGHALGLGHSFGNHIMSYLRNELHGLQQGDIDGIQEIYGER